MLDSFMTRADYVQLSKTVNSIGGSVSTAFLFTRIWARSTQYKGLWWDDYILIAAWAFQCIGNGLSAAGPVAFGFNIHNSAPHGWTFVFASLTLFYLSMALSKTAFAVTLLRLSAGRVKALLCVVIAVIWLFTIPAMVITWLDMCDLSIDVSISATCVSVVTLLWVHMGYAIATLLVDLTLAVLPWKIIGHVYLPSKERWGVSVAMSLTGFAGIVCIVRVVLASYGQELEKQGQDWTYGAVTCWGLMQAEIVIYIVAQTVPLLRVLFIGEGSRASRASQGSLPATDLAHAEKSTSHRSPAKVTDAIVEARGSIELVQLPGGKIVSADSEEGRAFAASRPVPPADAHIVAETAREAKGAPVAPGQRTSTVTVDDEVHRLWADMGLSRRAWSQSPECPPTSPVGRLGQQAANMGTLA